MSVRLGVAVCVLTVSVAGTASADQFEDMLANMDTSAPKYATPECQAARKAASDLVDGETGEVVLGVILSMGGILTLPITGTYNEHVYNKGRTISLTLMDACGGEVFVPYMRGKAEGGDDFAQAWMGQAYYKGFGVKQDYAQSAAWYRKAADQGNLAAKVNLGVLYNAGLGVPRDDAQAIDLWSVAADSGIVEADTNLGDLYRDRAPPDYGEALKWYRKGARHAHGSSEARLAAFYEFGHGVQQNRVYAYEWYSLAAQDGFTGAQARRDALAAALTPSEVQSGDTRAAKCRHSRIDGCDY